MGKLLLKTAALLLAVLLVLTALGPFLTPKWVEGHAQNGGTYLTTTTDGFFALEENSLDVLFIGSSQILRDIDPVQLEEETGFSAYSRATTKQAASVSYYYLKNALKTQSPRMVVIDPSTLYTEYAVDEDEAYVRYAFDTMPLDWDKITAIWHTIRGSEKQHMLDYLLPAVYYHDRLTELDAFDWSYPFIKDKSDPNRGAILLDDIEPQDFTPLTGDSDKAEPYAESSLYWYEKFVELCEQESIRLVMLRTPRVFWTEEMHAGDAAFAEAHSIPLIDFNLETLYTEAGLDDQTDFFDRGHLTAAGAHKLTHVLGGLLTELDG
ncbi:MAG: hypothetical protein J1E06_05250 [Acutalibacter sp.]|nr:hypothetical protein [Acutalibacter sp.]